jgi:hypothetical protein
MPRRPAEHKTRGCADRRTALALLDSANPTLGQPIDFRLRDSHLLAVPPDRSLVPLGNHSAGASDGKVFVCSEV